MIDRAKKTFKETVLAEWKKHSGGREFPGLQKSIDAWLNAEAEAVYERTRQIGKDENRITAAVVLFGKKLARLVKLLKILDKNGLSGEVELFEQLLELI